MSEWGDEPESVRLREVLGCFPSGVVALCSLVDGTPVGMAANSFTSVSLAPPLVSVCVQHISTTWPVLRQGAKLGLSVLAETQEEVCRKLARKGVDRFTDMDWAEGADDSVLVRDASAWLVTSVHSEIDAGDHVLVLLRVHLLDSDPGKAPLIFHRSGYRPLVEPAAGSEQGDRHATR